MAQERIKEQEMGARLAEIDKLQEIEVGGRTEINDGVIAAIAGVAAREIEGCSTWAPAPFAGPSLSALEAGSKGLGAWGLRRAEGRPSWTSIYR